MANFSSKRNFEMVQSIRKIGTDSFIIEMAIINILRVYLSE